MRTLPSALAAAQKKMSGIPYPRVEVFDRMAAVTRLTWDRLYTGAEPESYHAACIAGDGSLIRLRADPATNALYRQRVADPGQGSSFDTWVDWGVTAWAVALAADSAGAVLAFRAGLDGHLYRSESSDSGASWGTWQDMGDISGSADTRLAACFKNATTAAVLYTQANAVYRRRWDGSTWETPAAWTNTLDAITGLAVIYMGDWDVMVTGDVDSKPGVWTCVLGDGFSAAPGSWSALAELMRASPGSDTSFSFPALCSIGVFRAFFVEAYTGDEAYSRPHWTHTRPTAAFISNLWREPVPHSLESTHGLALGKSATHGWLCRPDGVWQADLDPPSLDLTDELLGLKTD
ncbi:MAG: hypothetical protein IBX68_12760, partial [Dehalococcoidia bacterium]|nr:hypothetical protein [Dehalococcoidia bacterium]